MIQSQYLCCRLPAHRVTVYPYAWVASDSIDHDRKLSVGNAEEPCCVLNRQRGTYSSPQFLSSVLIIACLKVGYAP